MRKSNDKPTNMTSIPPSESDGYYFDSSFSSRIREKYRVTLYRGVLPDLHDVDYDLMKFFCFLKPDEQERKHWMVQLILAMCRELGDLDDYRLIQDVLDPNVPLQIDSLSPEEKKQLERKRQIYYEKYVSPMVLGLTVMCMMGDLDQTLELNRCLSSEKSLLEIRQEGYTPLYLTAQIEDLYMLLKELQDNADEMGQYPGADLFDRDGQLKVVADGFQQLYRARKFREHACDVAVKAFTATLILGAICLVLFVSASTFGAGAAFVLIPMVKGMACYGMTSCLGISLLSAWFGQRGKGSENKKIKKLCVIKSHIQENQTSDPATKIRARYLNYLWDGLRELKISPYKERAHEWGRYFTCDFRVLRRNEDIPKMDKGYFLQAVFITPSSYRIVLRYRAYRGGFLSEVMVPDQNKFLDGIRKIFNLEKIDPGKYTIRANNLEEFIDCSGHAPWSDRSIEDTVGAAFRVAVRYFDQAIDLAGKNGLLELQKAVVAYQKIIDSMGYNEQRSNHLLEIGHSVRELVLRKVVLKERAMEDPDTQKYLDKIRRHNGKLEEKLEKRTEKLEDFIGKLGFVSQVETLVDQRGVGCALVS